MAEVTIMRNVVTPYPLYGLPYAITFPLLDADGDPISPSSPDSEISKNGDTFADCANEATEIATSSGICYLSFTGAEMTCDIATIQAKSTGAKTTVLVLMPRKLVTIRAGTSASAGSSTSTIVLDGSASAVDDAYNGMIVAAVIDGTTEVRMITDYVGSTQTATVVPDWNTAPDNNDTFTVLLPDGVQIQQADLRATGGTAYTAGAIPAAVAGATGGLFIAGTNAATTVTTSFTTTFTGNLTGSVGSLTTNNDKTGYALTSGERTAIANVVEAEIIDDTDSEKVLEAITNKIASVNPSLGDLTLLAIAAAVRTNLTTELGRIDVAVSSRLATVGYTAPPSAATISTQVASDLATAHGAGSWATATGFATAGDIPSANANADALLDRANGIETGVTFRQAERLMLSALAGKLSGAATATIAIRDVNDAKDRITATVTAEGNRTAVTLDPS